MKANADRDDIITRYRRRDIGEAELELIRGKIAQLSGQPGGRKAIAAAICEAWDWRQPRGTLAMRACGDLLLRLEEWGHVQLPTARSKRGSGPRRRKYPVLPPDLIMLTGLEVRDPEADLDSLVVRPITPEEREGWRLYMDRHHYLGCKPIVGEHLLYAAFLGDELVGLLGWGSAAFRAPLREAYVGWDESTKRDRLHLVANNVRFLVLPWVHVRHLASKVLAFNLRRLSSDWEQTWGHPIHLAETFVDTRRFRGTCYRASNWIYLGQTAGRSKRGNAYLHEGSPKALFVYRLHRRARRLLGGGPPMAVVVPLSVGEAPAQGNEARSSSRTASPTNETNEQGCADALVPAAVIASSPGQVSDDAGESGRRASLATVTSAIIALGAGPDATTWDPLPTPGTDAPTQAEPHTAAADEPEARADRDSSDELSARRRPGTNKTRIKIELTDAERAVVERQARGLAVPHRTVVRAKIILLLAAGESISAVARKLGCGRRRVRKWGESFVRKRVAGLEDAHRSGRPARFSPLSRSSPGQARL